MFWVMQRVNGGKMRYSFIVCVCIYVLSALYKNLKRKQKVNVKIKKNIYIYSLANSFIGN